jgi:FlaA1/EpsC-like NDP-sugar epimerase
LYTALIPHRRVVQIIADLAAWFAAIVLAVFLRYDGSIPSHAWGGIFQIYPVVASVAVAAGIICGLYLGRWSFGSFEEVAALLRAVGVTAAVFYLVDVAPRPVPASVPLTAAFVALVAMSGERYAWRLWIERRKRPTHAEAKRLLVFGAGDAGEQVITSLLRNPDSMYVPVVLLDDDPRKAKLRIRGVPVKGTRAEFGDVVRNWRVDTALIAIPTADATLMRDISALGAACDVDIRVLPPVSELFDGQIGESDIRPLTEADLLGRREVEMDIEAIAHYLSGKRVLVTGAGGSIGSELCRQIHRFGPDQLVMLDRDESALHGVQLSIEGRALLDDRNLVVADIRDADRLQEIFDEHEPHVVFHAAALKHLPLLEMHPNEAIKTNVVGTLNVLQAAERRPVERFVNISTDKAANPESVLGRSKRLTERLTAYADNDNEGVYLSVRFGNVLGSRGSVLTTFRAQIEAGGPVTVTHPEVTRYFMTVEEAVHLVIQAGAIGHGGTVEVLDMGEAVRIREVASRMIEASERPVEIVYTGLRPGEKLHEELYGDGEQRSPTGHPLITEVPVEPLAPKLVLDGGLTDDDMIEIVAEDRRGDGFVPTPAD